jgi:type I restriction enzyme, S subunit
LSWYSGQGPRLSYFLREFDSRAKGAELPLLAVSTTSGVIRKSELANGAARADSLDNYKVVKKDDLVLNRFNAYRGALGVAREAGLVSPDYSTLRVKYGEPRYIDYWFRSAEVANSMKSNMGGLGAQDPDSSGFSRVNVKELLKLKVHVSDKQEQKEIAEFLDAELSSIELLISKQNRLIEVLGLRRQALISEAVTKGLGKAHILRPTDVLWLGKIPETWQVAPLKAAFERVKRKPQDGAGIVTAFRDGQVTLRTNRRSDGFTEADDYSGYQGILPGDFAIHTMDAFAGAIGVSDSQGMCSPVLSVCVAKGQNDPRFMAYQLRLMAQRGWIEALSRSVRERTSEFRWAEAGSQKVALPPIEEQKAIADFLDRELKQIDILLEKQNNLTNLLNERRRSLVSEAVSGKIEVRGKK